MVEIIKHLASSDQELTVEERNLIAVAYMNVVCAHRASWRMVLSVEQKEESKGNRAQGSITKYYRIVAALIRRSPAPLAASTHIYRL